MQCLYIIVESLQCYIPQPILEQRLVLGSAYALYQDMRILQKSCHENADSSGTILNYYAIGLERVLQPI
jgi:hypothetical protein